MSPLPAREALDRLRAGNARFAAGASTIPASVDQRRTELTEGQDPFAIVLGCSDSRVPTEMVFDQGLGDLFVIRVAGNVVAPTQTGSVEFAATAFGTRLAVVLGHSSCGAVTATLDAVAGRGDASSGHLDSIVERIRPAVEDLVGSDGGADPSALVDEGVGRNVRASVEALRSGSDVLERLVRDDGLVIVGAVYRLDTGVVEFLDAQRPSS